MKQKILSICLIIVLLLQLSAPVGLIVYAKKSEKNMQENGALYKMEITILSIYEGVMRYDFTDIGTAATLYEHYFSPSNKRMYLLLETDENGQAFFRENTLEKPSGDIPYIQVDAERFNALTQYDVPETVPSYSQWRHITEANAYLYEESTIENWDPVAAQKWYLYLRVYNGRFTVEEITDAYGNPVETRLPELVG